LKPIWILRVILNINIINLSKKNITITFVTNDGRFTTEFALIGMVNDEREAISEILRASLNL